MNFAACVSACYNPPMAVEIEYKYLVSGDGWQADADEGIFFRQGYLASTADSGIRISIADDRAWLAVKKARTPVRRLEFEYPIPRADAEDMLNQLCPQGRLEKTRYRIPYAGHTWEVDVFGGANSGLVVAEIELDDENETFQRPDWLGEDISADSRFLAMNLARTPFSSW